MPINKTSVVDWKELFKSARTEETLFFDPATDANLQSIQNALGVSIPQPLAELLGQTNGIRDLLTNTFLVGNCEKIIEYNKMFDEWFSETEPLPPGKYLLFANDGFGDYFGYEIENGQIVSEKIGAFCPIENEFKIVANDLEDWVKRWFSGNINF